MLFEGYVWREELYKITDRIKMQILPLSDDQYYNIQKDISVAFFITRRLFELYKQGNRSKEFTFNIIAYKSIKKSYFSNSHQLEKLFNLEKEIQMKKNQNFLTNSIIHAMILSVDDSLNKLIFHSDFDRNKYLYKVDVTDILTFFDLVIDDHIISSVYERDLKTDKEIIVNYSKP